MSKPVVAIVGRPNVGKSSIFNALAGERISIVHNSPGVTRDRVYAQAEWFGREFTLVDTGGLDLKSEDPFLTQMARQVDFALKSANVIIFLCDVKEGLTNHDREIAEYLRRSSKPIVLAVNKYDHPSQGIAASFEFYELGLGEPIAVSAVHRLGLNDLMTEVLAHIPEFASSTESEERISVALIGKPNVGKSSLLNVLLAEDRAIVTDVPGTTRDALDVNLDNAFGKYRLIDTAGLRRKAKISDAVEKYSNLRTEAAVERADVCLILLDGSGKISEQDTKIAGLAHNAGKASLIVINKWDLVRDKEDAYRSWERQIRERLAFMPYAPILTISTLTGQRLEVLFEQINLLYDEARRRLSTSVINEVLAEAVTLHRPPTQLGKSLKIFYASQVATQPPQIVLFINDKKLLHFSYERYIENRFREAFGFEGSPLRLIWRERKRDDFLKIKDKDKHEQN